MLGFFLELPNAIDDGGVTKSLCADYESQLRDEHDAGGQGSNIYVHPRKASFDL